MQIGQGKYRIDPVAYYKKVIYAFTQPKWFYKKFYPRIPIEVLYTMLGVMTVVSILMTTLIAIVSGDFRFSTFIMSFIFLPISMAIGTLIQAVIFFILSSIFRPKKADFKKMWRLSCFSASVNAVLFTLPVGGFLGLVFLVAGYSLSIWFAYNLIVYYFQFSKFVGRIYLAFCSVIAFAMLAVGVSSAIALKRMEKKSHRILQSLEQDQNSELNDMMKSFRKMQEQMGDD